MIPKRIHTFWLSSNNPDNWVLENIKTWKEINPNYEIVIHYADEFDDLLEICPYYKKILGNHSWAYATDYLRSKVLYDQGGWYMDGDVTCHKPLDYLDTEFGERSRWIGLEQVYPFKTIECAVMGFEPHDPMMKALVDYYESWKEGDGVRIMPEVLNTVCDKNNISKEPILDPEYFSGIRGILVPIPKVNSRSAQAYKVGMSPSEKSYTVHHFTHTGY